MTRAAQIMIFLGMFAVILTLSHLYLFARFSHFLQLSYGQKRNLALTFAGLGILTLLSLPISRILPREAAQRDVMDCVSLDGLSAADAGRDVRDRCDLADA